MLFDDKTDKLIMVKEKVAQSEDEYDFNIRQTQERANLYHPNILTFINMETEDQFLIVKMYFEYPNEDLFEQKKRLKEPLELLKLISDVVSAMAFLERKRTVHGNIKPEFIYYKSDEDKYVLVDRLGDMNPPHQAQLNNIKYQQPLYMDPGVFESLVNGKTQLKNNPFKAELFCFGMVILSILGNNKEIQKVYNVENKFFDHKLLTFLIEQTLASIFVDEEYDIIKDFFTLCILNTNELERLSPKKAERVIEKRLNEFLEQRDAKRAQKKSNPEPVEEKKEKINNDHVEVDIKDYEEEDLSDEESPFNFNVGSKGRISIKPVGNYISDMSITTGKRESYLERDEAEDIELSGMEFQVELQDSENFMKKIDSVRIEETIEQYVEANKPTEKILQERLEQTRQEREKADLLNKSNMLNKDIEAINNEEKRVKSIKKAVTETPNLKAYRSNYLTYNKEENSDKEKQKSISEVDSFKEEVEIYPDKETEERNRKDTADFLMKIDKQIEVSYQKIKDHESISAKMNSVSNFSGQISMDKRQRPLGSLKPKEDRKVNQLKVNASLEIKKPSARKSVEFLDNMKRKQDNARTVNNRYAKTPEIQRVSNTGYKVVDSVKKKTFETIEEEPNENRLSKELDSSMLKKVLQSEVTVTSGQNNKRNSMQFQNYFNHQDRSKDKPQNKPQDIKVNVEETPIVKKISNSNPVQQKKEPVKRIHQSDKINANNNQINHIIVRSTIKSQQRMPPKPTLKQKPQQQGGLGVNMNELVLVRVDNGVPVYRYRKDLDPDFQPITN